VHHHGPSGLTVPLIALALIVLLLMMLEVQHLAH